MPVWESPKDNEALLRAPADDPGLHRFGTEDGEVRACHLSGRSGRRSWLCKPAVARVLGASAGVAFVYALINGNWSGDAGNSRTGSIVGLSEDSRGRTNTTDLFTYALRAFEGKGRPISISTTPKSTLPPVYSEEPDWHSHFIKPSEVMKRIHTSNYRGKTKMSCIGITAVGFSMNPSEGPGFEKLKFFHHMGANCFKLLVTWERLQLKIGSQDLNLVPGLDEVVNYITRDLGDRVIIVPQNREGGLMHKGLNAMKSDFAKLWAAMAEKWKGNDKVIFGLYGEPRGGYEAGKERYFDPDSTDDNGEMVEFWRQWAQASISAIRKTGSKNLVLVPGLRGSSCSEWDGAGRWGEKLDGKEHAGNTRLAALHDPEANLAYDVHQHMDSNSTGESPGCDGHDGHHGAFEGLKRTIAWAKKYNKRLMMTELSSIPGKSPKSCQKKLNSYLQLMFDSGVFLGYQVWQFGCESCLGDLWSKQPLNLDWYRLHDFGNGCVSDGVDCREARCCTSHASQCYQKDFAWANCKKTCTPGIDYSEPEDARTNWSCAVLTYTPRHCSDVGQDCSKTQCCNDPGMKCYVKEPGYAACRRSCHPGWIWPKDDPAHRTPWNCTELGVFTGVQLK